jgi:dynein heavy chain
MMASLMPIVMALGNKDLNEGHWIQIFEIIDNGPTFISNMQAKRPFNLQELIASRIEDHKDFVEEISSRASGEASIDDDLEKIKKEWSELAFTVDPYRTYKDKFILKEVGDVYQVLDDHQLKLQAMLANRYVGGIRAKVEEWESKLALVQEIMEEWLDNQQRWIYLENIFSAEDIVRQLPGESAKFQMVDKSWKDVMLKAYKKPNVLDNCNSDEVLKKFQENNKILDKIQKMLEDYLEKKRRSFPRFYFLSNDELIEILSQTRNPHAVQPH